MREALTGSINGQGGLTNAGEVVILYYWDGQTDLVTDLDYVLWGDKDEAVDKTGVSIDGPDADGTTSSYLADTAISAQDIVGTGSDPHTSGNSAQREDLSEGAEVQTGGNGADGHDETSEDLSNTWSEDVPTPGAAKPGPSPDLGVTKEGPSCVFGGEEIVYTITVDNLGTADATGVVLTDTLPLSTTYASDDSGWDCPACVPGASGEITWAVGVVPSSTIYSVNLTVTVDANATVGQVFTNEVEIFTDLPGDSPDNNSDSWETMLAAALRIHDVQGAAHLSPYEGEMVCLVPGIVTVVRSTSFYMQDPSPDADDATSEGIMVYVGSSPGVNEGDEVLVSGQVEEYYPGGYGSGNLSTTQISAPTIAVQSTGNPLPDHTVVGTGGRVPPDQVIEDDATGDVNTSGVFDPEEDGIDFYESLESMLLQVNDALAVAPTNYYGEIAIVGDGGVNAGAITPRGGIAIQLGDFNPERILIDDTIVSSEPQVTTGDVFAAPVTGVLDYTFGNFKLFNTTDLPAITPGGLISETTDLTGTAEHLTVATFNVLNLDPSDGTFDGLGVEIVDHLKAPDIVALQEIQDSSGPTNDGTVDASLTYRTLITAVLDAGGPTYEYRDVAPENNQDGGEPGGNIRVGFLFRPDRVTFVDRGAATATDATAAVMGASGLELTLSPGRIDPTNAAFDDSRKPLAGEFVFNGQTVLVVANHFNSKGGDGYLFGRVQPPVFDSEVQRIQQAQVVNDFVDSVLALDPGANVIVLGDLNDFQFSEPISDYLAADVLTNLAYSLPVEERYTYIYDGNSQALDHILVSAHLAHGLPEVDVVHMNAEFLASDRPSDHDPVVARFWLPHRVYFPLIFKDN
jgi:uncharacterized repeat protein (TIGR01451 family)